MLTFPSTRCTCPEHPILSALAAIATGLADLRLYRDLSNEVPGQPLVFHVRAPIGGNLNRFHTVIAPQIYPNVQELSDEAALVITALLEALGARLVSDQEADGPKFLSFVSTRHPPFSAHVRIEILQRIRSDLETIGFDLEAGRLPVTPANTLKARYSSLFRVPSF